MVVPAAGRPITPARRMRQCTEVAIGEVSVEPHAESISTSSPRDASEAASRRSQSGGGSEAAA